MEEGSFCDFPFLVGGDFMFQLNGVDWIIVFVDSASPKLVRYDGTRTVGMTELYTQTVYIANNLVPSFEWKVICHEIVHCAMFSYNIYLTVEQEEVIADLIATYGKEIIQTTDKIFNKLHRRYAV